MKAVLVPSLLCMRRCRQRGPNTQRQATMHALGLATLLTVYNISDKTTPLEKGKLTSAIGPCSDRIFSSISQTKSTVINDPLSPLNPINHILDSQHAPEGSRMRVGIA